jgi:hypothetical protein
MDYIVKYESDEKYNKNIIRPLSSFKSASDFFQSNKKNARIGLVLCHGHNHSIEIFKKIKFINYWYMIDKNINTWPDYICDVTNKSDLEYFPNNFFDCIMTSNNIGSLREKSFTW